MVSDERDDIVLMTVDSILAACTLICIRDVGVSSDSLADLR